MGIPFGVRVVCPASGMQSGAVGSNRPAGSLRPTGPAYVASSFRLTTGPTSQALWSRPTTVALQPPHIDQRIDRTSDRHVGDVLLFLVVIPKGVAQHEDPRRLKTLRLVN